MLYRLIVISLFVAVAISAQNITVDSQQLAELQKVGVVVIPYDPSPNFAQLAKSAKTADVPDSDALGAILPYSLVLQNTTNNVIVAYATRWTATDYNGKARIQDHLYSNMRSLDGYAIPPNSSRLLMPVSGYSQTAKSRAPNFQTAVQNKLLEFSKNAKIECSLEAVIFDNGLGVGADHANVIPRMAARSVAQSEVLAGVLSAYPQGDSAVIDYLKGLSSGARQSTIVASQQKNPEGAYAAFLGIQKSEFASMYLMMANRDMKTLVSIAESQAKAPQVSIHR